ncbi:PglD-related sugar-binding protein [Olivibacter domesticus]|uniref:UDP-N-acetylbacillosamine N-acetyltransferase n=1 Tax=Olivibacter domesticus TaxID=407022 RepID=A0A1H7UW27_OLID1|nr:hypothetical protein [Olivibacter domesticus]SEM01151.1 UDP-N-acetylbacillosamine N-acetyltransferase [Olivibacter domesticus]
MEKSLLLYGKGGHSVVLQDCAKRLGYSVVGFFDEQHPYVPTYLSTIPLLIAIGAPSIRKRVAEHCYAHSFMSLIHPSATVAENVEIGEGSVVLAGAVIQPGAKIGKHVIINANVTIDHDAIVKDYVTTYPGVYIGAGATVEDGVLIHSNAVIMRRVSIASFAEIEPASVLKA